MTISAFRKWFKVHRSKGTALSSDFPTATWTLEIIGRGTLDWEEEEEEEGTAWKGIRKMGAWWGCKGFKSSIGELNYWMKRMKLRRWLDWDANSNQFNAWFVFHCSENSKHKSNTTQPFHFYFFLISDWGNVHNNK